MSQTTQTTLDETMAKLERQESLLSNTSELMFDPNEVVEDDEFLQDAQIVTADSVYMPVVNLEASFMQPYDEEKLKQELAQKEEELMRAMRTRPYRQRFLSEYKQKKLNRGTDADRKLIALCETACTIADCKLDADLYATGEDMRTDEHAYICLYGLHPSVVNGIDYTPTIAAIDFYAKMVASKAHLVTPIFHRRFADFLRALEESGYESGYADRDGQSSPVYKAYSAYVDSMETEIVNIPDKMWR